MIKLKLFLKSYFLVLKYIFLMKNITNKNTKIKLYVSYNKTLNLFIYRVLVYDMVLYLNNLSHYLVIENTVNTSQNFTKLYFQSKTYYLPQNYKKIPLINFDNIIFYTFVSLCIIFILLVLYWLFIFKGVNL